MKILVALLISLMVSCSSVAWPASKCTLEKDGKGNLYHACKCETQTFFIDPPTDSDKTGIILLDCDGELLPVSSEFNKVGVIDLDKPDAD